MRNLSSRSERPRPGQGIRLIPSEDIGEYEEPARPFVRPPGGGLFPLDEEGTYGPPPIYGYTRRPRKPKVYASYSISSKSDQDDSEAKKKTSSKTWISSTSTSSSSFSSVCPSPRSSSLSRPPSRLSNSPVPSFNSSRTSKSPSPGLRISKSPIRSNRRLPSPSPDRQTQKLVCVSGSQKTDTVAGEKTDNVAGEKSVVRRIAREVKARNARNSNKIRSSSLKAVARNMRDSSFEENEEYSFKCNEKCEKSGARGLSLAALREPVFPKIPLGKVNLPDSNITTNIANSISNNKNINSSITNNKNTNNSWNITSVKRQSTISKSIVRKTSYSSHAM